MNVLVSRVLAAFVFMLLLASCGQHPDSIVNDRNIVTNGAAADRMVEGYRVVRRDVLQAQIQSEAQARSGVQGLLSASNGAASAFLKKSSALAKDIYEGTASLPSAASASTTASAPAQDSLILGLPFGILGDERVFGGVITQVSNHDDENLGNLKLSDFPMIHGRLFVSGLDGNSPQVVFVGCVNDCSETTQRVPLIGFPIVAVDADQKLLMIDLSAVGSDLDLISMMDPDGSATGLKSVSTVAKSFDFSLQTLVFDVESKLTAVDPANHPMPDMTLTVRWYLNTSAAFDPSFVSRSAIPGVGFFMTSHAATPKITRFSLARFGDQGIKYYIKNVPAEWQPAFASAFDEWNETFQKLFGRKIFDYEFIAQDDPRNALLVTGDIRYNIVEWDLTNKASYGGLGPSFANQYTGEHLAADVLIQGPTIIQLYSDWFKLADQVKVLQAQNRNAEADALLKRFSSQADAGIVKTAKHSLKLGTQSFTIRSELAGLEDPHAERNDFDELPPNVDFKSYMNGYFHDMLTHELGHNLGLRHNFRGNLGATDTGEPGSTSRSVMEYLGRGFRYLDHVGEYDRMAIRYGYGNIKPDHLDWFCTDEDAFDPSNPATSPECSADDATQDPYAFFEQRLAKAIDYLTARGRADAPEWTQADLTNELGVALKGLMSYAILTPGNAASLTNFFGKDERPSDQAGVKEFVVARVRQQLCDPSLDQVIASKLDAAAQAKTRTNLEKLRETALNLFQSQGIALGFDVDCGSRRLAQYE